MFNMRSRKSELEKFKTRLNSLINSELVLLNNGHFINKNNKIEIVYDNIQTLLKDNELNKLPDSVLINLIKQIDDSLTCSTKNNGLFFGKNEYIKEIANEIKKIIPLRLNKLIHKAEFLIRESNNLIKQDLLNEINYVEVYNTKIMLEYYLQEVLYAKKIQKLILELGFIFNKKIQFKIVETKGGKAYEKTCISI